MHRINNAYNLAGVDALMPRNSQLRWLENPTLAANTGKRGSGETSKQQQTRRYQRLVQLPHADKIIAVMREYIQSSVPAIKEGESTVWTCTCLPDGTDAIYVRIQVGLQTTFQAFVHNDQPVFCWYLPRRLVEAIFTVSLAATTAETQIALDNFPSRSGLRVMVGQADIKRHDSHQLFYICTVGIPGTLALLDEVHYLAAVRHYNLSLAKCSPGTGRSHHCFELADWLVR